MIQPVFAAQNGFGLGLKTHVLVLPSLTFSLPINSGDSLEYTTVTVQFFDTTSYYNMLVYRKEIRATKDSRQTLNLGLLHSHHHIESSSWGWFGGTSGPSSSEDNYSWTGVIAFEQENAISDNFYYSFRAGYPELIGIGLKFYI